MFILHVCETLLLSINSVFTPRKKICRVSIFIGRKHVYFRKTTRFLKFRFGFSPGPGTEDGLRQEKNSKEQRVITDYMHDISKFCRLWLSKTYTAKVINSH